MANTIEVFRQHIIEAGVLDPEGTHHEFVSGMHGRKLDFDTIPTGSDLFKEWVQVAAERLQELYPGQDPNRMAILSVANGTNRLIPGVAGLLGCWGLLTKKVSAKAVEVEPASKDLIRSKVDPDLIVAIEDVGTTGSTSSTAVSSAREAGARRVEALNTWQRRETLEYLVGIDAVYHSIILEPLPTYTPEECKTSGYCSQDWQFIEHAK